MSFIQWSDSYNVGIATIDSQHKVLVEMINSLYTAMVEHKSKEALEKSFALLDEYILSHFTTEEYYMQLYRYPNFNEHKLQHDEFTKQIKDFKKKYAEGKMELTLELTKYLKNWFIVHIKTYDPLYVSLLKNKNI